MLELPTYTKLFEVERKLYKVFDLELPRPIGLLETLAFAVTLAVIAIFMDLIGQGVTANDAFLYVVPPGLAAWLVSQPFSVTDGKRPHRWLEAQIKYLLEPRHLVRFESSREPRSWQVEEKYWQSLGADWLRRD
jgi:TcpE family